MKTTANIATFPPRRVQLLKMLDSIKGQFDETRVYFNEINDYPKWLPDWVDVYCGDDCNGNLTDNGKFYHLEENQHEYYFTLDDDIAYPSTYAVDMVAAIERTGGIVTHHGRILKALNVSYYRSGVHKAFACLQLNKVEKIIDVAGTGVTAFSTEYFNPMDLWKDPRLKMSDLIFSEEAAKQGKKITVLKHSKDYFRYLHPDEETTIHQQSFRSCPVQTHIANQIYILKHDD